MSASVMTVMTNSFLTTLRSLKDEEEPETTYYFDDIYDEYTVVKNSNPLPDRMPLWIFMIIIAVVAAIMAFCVFYVSHRSEWSSKETKDNEEEDLEQGNVNTTTIPTKTFTDSTRFHAISPSIYALDDEDDETKSVSTRDTSHDDASASCSSSASKASSSPSSNNGTKGSLQQAILRATPRCVLCSKAFHLGECITHSNNPCCHHEYHEACLQKYWKTTKQHRDQCPVCKATYVVGSLSPSKDFSMTDDGMSSVTASSSPDHHGGEEEQETGNEGDVNA